MAYNKFSGDDNGAFCFSAANNNVVGVVATLANTQYKANFGSHNIIDSFLWVRPIVNRLLYQGAIRKFLLQFNCTISVNSNNRLLGISVYKNGIQIPESLQECYANTSGQPVFISTSIIDFCSSGDFYEIYVRNATAAGDTITVKHYTTNFIEV